MTTSKIRQVVAKEGVLFSFYGALSQSFVDFFLDSINKQFQYSRADKQISKALIIVAIEAVQNIINYTQEKITAHAAQCTSMGLVTLGYDKNKGTYYVNASNEIDPNDQERITEKIEYINALDETQKRKYLRQKLKSGEDMHQKGAGVGFIEMAKRSSHDLHYSFEQIDGRVYFNILVYI